MHASLLSCLLALLAYRRKRKQALTLYHGDDLTLVMPAQRHVAPYYQYHY
jgi:hypothetical protein